MRTKITSEIIDSFQSLKRTNKMSRNKILKSVTLDQQRISQ